jgi:glycosyltransferase involved in cell wall biosynthesis
LNVLYVYADSPKEWNCSEWNCIIPSKAINRTKGNEAQAIYINDFVKNGEDVQKLCSGADIIVVERNFFSDVLTMMQFWKVRGKTILAIFDDAYDKMHPENVSYNFWMNGKVEGKDAEGKEVSFTMKPHPLTQFKWALQIAKGIQVPSVNLAKDWGVYNNTYFVHNYLDIEKYMDIEPLHPHPEDEIWIGWCGSMSHVSSFTDSGVVRALETIAKRYPKVKIFTSGDKRIFDMINVENKQFSKYVPAEDWTSLVKTLDIGLAPLSGPYDQRRSWIKALEYMALKIPWIATNYITYDELSDYGIMTENGYHNWLDALTNAIENFEDHKKLAEGEAYEFALEQSSDKNVTKVTLPLYEKLINEPYPILEEPKAYLNVPNFLRERKLK